MSGGRWKVLEELGHYLEPRHVVLHATKEAPAVGRPKVRKTRLELVALCAAPVPLGEATDWTPHEHSGRVPLCWGCMLLLWRRRP